MVKLWEEGELKMMALSRQQKKYVDQSPYFESWREEI
jgi:hypothetical protein